jgi:hypothetical protein
MELFTGRPHDNPLDFIVGVNGANLSDEPVPIETINQHLEELKTSMAAMHKKIVDKRETRALLNQKHQRGEHIMNFDVGDFVLRSRVDTVKASKLLVTWVGPYQVISAESHNAFCIQDLITKTLVTVHASRLKFYHDSSLNVTQEIIDHVASQGTMLLVEGFERFEWSDEAQDYKVLVKWQGLEMIENSWELCQSLAEDVPKLMMKFATDCNDKDFMEYVARLC